MSLNWPKAGANHVPSYQISGIPYVTRSVAGELGSGDVIKVAFPYVTRFFVIGNNSGGTLRVGFTENGVNATETANYFCVKPFTSGALRYEVRCKELFLRRDSNADSGFEIMAGLTNVHADQFPILSGTLYTYGFESPQNNGVVTSSWPGVG